MKKFILTNSSQPEKIETRAGYWRFGVRCRGVKKKCRTIAWHHADDKEMPESNERPTDAQLIESARSWLSTNIKSWDKAEAQATYWTFTTYGGEQWEPFNDSHNIKLPISAL
jgi:hypothetical protein